MNFFLLRQDPAYRQELRDYLLFYSRITAVTTIVLVLAGAGLDHVFYPDKAWEFGWMRVAGALLITLVLLSYSRPWGRSHLRPLTYFWLCVPQAMICWMIYMTDGEQSIYFVGLTFALSGIGFFLPLSVGEALAFGAVTLLAYTLGCVLREGGIQDVNEWLGNMTFIGFYAIICVVISIYSEKWRWMSFRLKVDVQQKNAELLATNEALAQVKGQLIQQEKMAALGTLSAGLLHEVNNPVNYSLMALNMALLEPEVARNETLKESITDAKTGMQRVQNIVTDLKTFAYQKPGEGQNRVFPMEKAIQSALRLTAFELKGVKVVLEFPLDTHVLGDEPALIGVMINLLNNAGLALRQAETAVPRIDIRARGQAGRLYVTVRDYGSGIKPENLGRVFEPFFTTRDVGQGLGLGLSMCYSIIQRHGGVLGVASEDGAWTEFSFDLALADEATGAGARI